MLFPVILGWVLLVLLTEGGMWWLFRRGMVRICLPQNLTTIKRPWMTMAAMHLFALCHTIFMVITIVFSYLFLW